ncbi:MAG: apolipoprotein D and lipocalin family protein [Paraglaciecola sp.]
MSNSFGYIVNTVLVTLPGCFKISSTILLVTLLIGCTAVPEGITPVNNFELPRYLGKWYEIARLDHSFERGLEQVSATYSLQDDGGVKVINRGFSPAEQEWQEAQGKAYFVGDPDKGHLKVSFFGPFYASYVIFLLDTNAYEYAMITGPDREYLWILSRSAKLTAEILESLVLHAKKMGFETDKLIYVNHQS